MADPVFPLVLGSLPLPRTRLIGREAEIATARTFLLDAAIPVLTLTEPGGVGKTRLALAVASALADVFPDGVRFVSLASVLDPIHVPFTVARALGLQDVRGSDPIEHLATVLDGRELLLVLDNLEHLLPAAQWIANLLQICAEVKALATSRERLRIDGEQEMPVLPLALPDRSTPLSFDWLSENAAICLFAARTQASEPRFSLTPENVAVVAEICRRLDGLPLAIELAAAHAKVLPPPALLTRLERRLPLLVGGSRDAPARQRTMRDTIAWSYDLLSSEERSLLSRMAVFAGGCTLEAAEWVAGATLDTFGLIASLVDRSLLWRIDDGTGEPRFRMLETIREFAWEQVAASGEEQETRRRHAMWCLALAQRYNPRDRPSNEVRLRLDHLEAERDNLRTAMAWLLDSGEIETALSLGAQLERLWLLRGPASEGRAWVERALAAAAERPTSLAIRGLAAQTASILAWMEGDFDEAAERFGESLGLCWSTIDLWSLPKALEGLAGVAVLTAQPERAVRLLAAAAALRDRTGAPVMIADRGFYEQIVQRSRQRLSSDLFATAWDAGRALPLGDVVAEALALADGPVPPDEPSTASFDREGDGVDGDLEVSGLSSREREVLRLIAAGHSNAEIAHMLFISPRTASTHAGHILRKLGLTTRAELIAFAHRQGLA